MPGGERFRWQGSYGAFTVSRKDVARVREYIRRQEAHHRDPGRLWRCEAFDEAASDSAETEE